MKECIFGWLFYTYKNESLFVHMDKGYVLVRKEVRYLHLQKRQVMLSSFHRLSGKLRQLPQVIFHISVYVINCTALIKRS